MTQATGELDQKGLKAALISANELTCGGGAPVHDYVSGIIRAYLRASEGASLATVGEERTREADLT